jgi:hypothetical protein
MLVVNGENVKVIQELMRHASSPSCQQSLHTRNLFSGTDCGQASRAPTRGRDDFPEDLTRDHSIGKCDVLGFVRVDQLGVLKTAIGAFWSNGERVLEG